MLNVLIVEDDLTIADLLQEALETDGFHVTGIASTVKAAVQSAEQHRPDFAIIDIRLAAIWELNSVHIYGRQPPSKSCIQPVTAMI